MRVGRGGEQIVYISSADLMPRNLEHRVELAVPIEDPQLRAEVLGTVEMCLRDNQNAWQLDANARWTRLGVGDGEQPFSAQEELMRLHLLRAGETPSSSG